MAEIVDLAAAVAPAAGEPEPEPLSAAAAAAAADEDEDDEEDGDVCRICRNRGDDEHPLRYPCACSGNIKFVTTTTPASARDYIRHLRELGGHEADRDDAGRERGARAVRRLAGSLPIQRGYMKERSSIAVIGLSIHTAPVEMREKLAVAEELWPRAVSELTNLNHIEEAAVLSTCNRMEIYVVALSWNRGIREVVDWMSKKSGIPASELREHLFMLRDSDATRHLFEVSAGLDSLVLGEGQILAQVKQVVRSGQNSGGLGKNIDRMFKDAITAGKRVRSETNISSGAVSVSSAAVELALMKLPRSECSSARMLLIGVGKMGKLVIKHLIAKGCKKVVVVNRSVERVDAIREEMSDIEIVYRPLTEMYEAAADADVVFTSTSSESPLFMKEHAEVLPPISHAIGGVRLFVDISVPRNVSACVSDVGHARVYNVDDLKEVVEDNKQDRLRKAMEAQTIITEELKRFEAWKDSLETVPTIKSLRSYADRIRASELDKCLKKIGEDALTKKTRKSIEQLSTGIVNKLLHGPLQHLRCDGTDSHTLSETLENMHALNRMFSLDTEKAIMEQKIKAKVEKKTQN